MTAETLSSDDSDTAFFINQLTQDAGCKRTLIYTDNIPLHDSVNTTIQIADYRLCIEIPSIIELQDNEEISICWISKDIELADCSTKKRSTMYLHHVCATRKESKSLISLEFYPKKKSDQESTSHSGHQSP